MSRIIFDSRPPSEKRTEKFNFLSRLAPGETVDSAVITVLVESGVDPIPSDILSGSLSIASPIVSQDFLDGVVGVIYKVTCSAETSLGQVLQLAGYMAVVQDTQ